MWRINFSGVWTGSIIFRYGALPQTPVTLEDLDGLPIWETRPEGVRDSDSPKFLTRVFGRSPEIFEGEFDTQKFSHSSPLLKAPTSGYFRRGGRRPGW